MSYSKVVNKRKKPMYFNMNPDMGKEGCRNSWKTISVKDKMLTVQSSVGTPTSLTTSYFFDFDESKYIKGVPR